MKITLDTLSQASAKEVLDQVSTHLLKQGERAVNAVGGCIYRTKEGLACAVGCLMTDKEAESTPNEDWGYLVDTGSVTSIHHALILELQDIHDHSLPENWAKRLHIVQERLASGVY